MSILTTIELDIEGELKTAWGVAESAAAGVGQTVVKDADILWNDARGLLVTMLPTQWTLFKTFVAQAMKDVASGDVADLETAVLNLASASGAAFVAGLGRLLTVFVTLAKTSL